MSNVVFTTEFGSFLYGTNIETSDKDYKSIYLPEARDIILQSVKDHLNDNTKASHTEKNVKSDVDHETFSLQAYIKLLCEGQTVALDMLFSPKAFHIKNFGGVFSEIKFHKDKFLHRGTSSFVGYTRMQAAKYGVKGSRIAAIRLVLDVLTPFLSIKRYMKLGEALAEIKHPLPLANEYIKTVELTDNHGRKEWYLEVCNRKVPFHATVQYTYQVFQKIFDEYGKRALMAEKNEGIDWKALMHAVRVAHEAQELLLTGRITFPRPEKELLLKIRKGELPYKEVADIIENGLVKVEEAKSKSSLPDKPNLKFAENFVYHFYLKEIK